MNYKQLWHKLKKKPLKKSDWLILVLAGILLMIIVFPVPSDIKEKKETKSEQEAAKQKIQEDKTEDELEIRLEEILSRMDGVGEVKVMITYKDSGTHVVEKDRQTTLNTVSETDSAGGVRTTKDSSQQESTVYDEAEGGNEPFVSQELKPQIEGILVVASGGDDAVVQKNISEAVLALFHVDAHRIKIVKMNWQEGGA